MTTEVLSPVYSAVKDAHASATTAKTPILLNSLITIPLNTALAAANNIFVYKADRVRVPKVGSQVWSALDKIYWDDTAKNFTKTLTSNTLAGIVVEDALSADTEGEIELNPFVNA